MNEIRHVTCKNAGVKDQRNISYDSTSNICQEVTKICTLLHEYNYLQNITELCQNTDIPSKILRSSDLVNTDIAFSNLKKTYQKYFKMNHTKLRLFIVLMKNKPTVRKLKI